MYIQNIDEVIKCPRIFRPMDNASLDDVDLGRRIIPWMMHPLDMASPCPIPEPSRVLPNLTQHKDSLSQCFRTQRSGNIVLGTHYPGDA